MLSPCSKKSVGFLEIYYWQGEKQVVYCRRSYFPCSADMRIAISRIGIFGMLEFSKRRWWFYDIGQRKSDMGTASLTSNLLLLISLFCREFDLWLFCCILCLACVVRNLIFGTFQSVQNELWHFYTAGRQVLANGDALVYGDVDADGQADRHRKGDGKNSWNRKIVHKQIETYTKY